MTIVNHAAIQSHLAARNYDSVLRYVVLAFAIVAIAVLYLASSGPGLTEAELAMASVFP
jgi:hypothetical protein